MDREIKFRGLRTDGKGWVYGYYSPVIVPILGTLGHCINEGGYRDIDVIPETVGQYTGLKDKNGVEIYEGDIFTSDEYPFKDDGVPNYVGVVHWVFAGFQYYLKCVNPDKRGISEGINEPIEDGNWIEVIGNIHESATELKEE